jgi:hypothetical protein
MSSLSSNEQRILHVETSILTKIAAVDNHNLDRHFARIVARNPGLFDREISYFWKEFFFLENLYLHLESMYNLLRPDDRLTLVRNLPFLNT